MKGNLKDARLLRKARNFPNAGYVTHKITSHCPEARTRDLVHSRNPVLLLLHGEITTYRNCMN